MIENPWNLEPEPQEESNMKSSEKDKELDYADIINLIIRFYNLNSYGESFWDEGEEWKRCLATKERLIPADLENVVKRSFIFQLRRIIGSEF